jgi:hypothetical protein
MYGVGGDIVLRRDQNPADQFAMATEKLTYYQQENPLKLESPW